MAKKTATKKPKISATRQKYLNALEVYGKEIERSFKYDNSGSKNSWKQAKKNRKVNCARYIGWALQAAGVLAIGKYFYWKNNSIRGNGASLIRKSKKTSIKKYGKHTAKQLAKIGELKEGDIVLSKNHTHTQAFKSYNKKTGALHWYSAGGSNVRNKNVRNARQSGYDDVIVMKRIRVK